jgi:oligopeptide/dipeptide ABC transporter ATP-binding protein
MVIYCGRIVETAPCDELFAAPVHPYTRALLAAVPDPTRAFEAPDAAPAAVRPREAGEPPPGGEIPSGCAFRDRCAYAQDRCAAAVPRLESLGGIHEAACHRRGELVYS